MQVPTYEENFCCQLDHNPSHLIPLNTLQNTEAVGYPNSHWTKHQRFLWNLESRSINYSTQNYQKRLFWNATVYLIHLDWSIVKYSFWASKCHSNAICAPGSLEILTGQAAWDEVCVGGNLVGRYENWQSGSKKSFWMFFWWFYSGFQYLLNKQVPFGDENNHPTLAFWRAQHWVFTRVS